MRGKKTLETGRSTVRAPESHKSRISRRLLRLLQHHNNGWLQFQLEHEDKDQTMTLEKWNS